MRSTTFPDGRSKAIVPRRAATSNGEPVCVGEDSLEEDLLDAILGLGKHIMTLKGHVAP